MKGHTNCLPVLHEFAASTLSSGYAINGQKPAHFAAQCGNDGYLRALHNLGVSLSDRDDRGSTPAHVAAEKGHAGCLRVLKELGVSLSDRDNDGMTPAPGAAANGHAG